MPNRGFGIWDRIFELYQHLRPHHIEQHSMDVTTEIEEFYNVFRDINEGTQLILLPTMTPIGVFGLTFKFQRDSTDSTDAGRGNDSLADPQRNHGDLVKDGAPTAAGQAEVQEPPAGSVDYPDDVYGFNSVKTRSWRSRRRHK